MEYGTQAHGCAPGVEAGVAEVREWMRQAFAARSTRAWSEFFTSQPEIICEKVQSYEEVLEDPQAIANDYIIPADLPGIGARHIVGTLVTLGTTPGSAKTRPPALGGDTAAVMSELGFTGTEIEEVRIRAETVRAGLTNIGDAGSTQQRVK